IASELGGVHAWMKPGETGLVAQPENAVSFADAACRLLDEPGLCARLGRQARESSSKMFSYDRFLQGINELYLKMTDSDAGVFAVKSESDGNVETPRRILVDSLPFDHGQSGISVYTASVIKALQKAGHQVTVLATPADQPYFPDSNVITTPKWAERVIGSILYHVLNLPSLLKKGDYDFCLVTAATRRFPRHSEIPVIGTIHDLAQCRDKKKYGRLRNFYLNHVLARWVRRNATRIVAVSEFSLHEAIKFWRISPDRIFFSYNGVTLPKHEESGFLEQFGLKAGHYILFISRILPQKTICGCFRHTSGFRMNSLKSMNWSSWGLHGMTTMRCRCIFSSRL
ncbi:MAG: glycosyltransferase, partial [Victivallales bacterium]|nr:glycosyltransferase [Victivallales bacterium]